MLKNANVSEAQRHRQLKVNNNDWSIHLPLFISSVSTVGRALALCSVSGALPGKYHEEVVETLLSICQAAAVRIVMAFHNSSQTERVRRISVTAQMHFRSGKTEARTERSSLELRKSVMSLE